MAGQEGSAGPYLRYVSLHPCNDGNGVDHHQAIWEGWEERRGRGRDGALRCLRNFVGLCSGEEGKQEEGGG